MPEPGLSHEQITPPHIQESADAHSSGSVVESVVSSAALHRRLVPSDPKADREQEERKQKERALTNALDRYNDAYESLEALFQAHPTVDPGIEFDGKMSKVRLAALELDNEVRTTIISYNKVEEGVDSPDYAVTLENVSNALPELAELRALFEEAISTQKTVPVESPKVMSDPIRLPTDVPDPVNTTGLPASMPTPEPGPTPEPESITPLETLAVSLEADLKKWEAIRTAIQEKSDLAGFENAMRSLPVPDLAKKSGLKEAQKMIGRLKKVLAQAKKPNEDLQVEIDALERNLAKVIPAGETLLASLPPKKGKGETASSEPRSERNENTDRMPLKDLERAVALIARWDEMGKEVGMKRLLDVLKEKYPAPQHTLPHVRTIAGRVAGEYRDPEAWSGNIAEKNRGRLDDDIKQLEGIAGDAEQIVAEIREKEAATRKVADNNREPIPFEEALPKLGQLLARWKEISDRYGDSELREMMFQDRGPEFPPVSAIDAWFTKESERGNWGPSERDVVLHDALPKMTIFVDRAEAAAKKLQPKDAAEGNSENDLMPKDKLLQANELITRWRELCDECGVIRLRKAIRKKHPREAELPIVPDINAWLDEHQDPKMWKGRSAQRNQVRLDTHLVDLTGLVKDAELVAADIRSHKAERAAAEEKKEAEKSITIGDIWEASAKDPHYAGRRIVVTKVNDDDSIEYQFFDLNRAGNPANDDEGYGYHDGEGDFRVWLEKEGFNYKGERESESTPAKKITVLATGRAVESDTQMTAWENLTAKDARAFIQLINTTELNGFQSELKRKLTEKGITNSVDRLRVGKVALDRFMPGHIRKLAKQKNFEITDEEIEKFFMVGLRNNLFVS